MKTLNDLFLSKDMVSRLLIIFSIFLLPTSKVNATPLSLEYTAYDIGSGLFQYDFDLILDNNDGTWTAGEGFDWFVIGDVASGSSPIADFSFTSVPTGWATTSTSGIHNGPTIYYGVNVLSPRWVPTGLLDSVSWSGTSATFLGEGALKWSYLEAPDFTTRALFKTATFVEADVSEPTTLALMGLGLFGLGLPRRKRLTQY